MIRPVARSCKVALLDRAKDTTESKVKSRHRRARIRWRRWADPARTEQTSPPACAKADRGLSTRLNRRHILWDDGLRPLGVKIIPEKGRLPFGQISDQSPRDLPWRAGFNPSSFYAVHVEPLAGFNVITPSRCSPAVDRIQMTDGD